MSNEIYRAEKDMRQIERDTERKAEEHRLLKLVPETESAEEPRGWLATRLSSLASLTRAAVSHALRPSMHSSPK